MTWGGSSSGVISFCLYILFMGFSWQEYWSGLLFPPLLDHIFSELFTMTCLSWVALHGMAHSFIGLRKPVHHDKAVFVKERLLYIEWINNKVLLHCRGNSIQYPVITCHGKEPDRACIDV